MTALIFLGWRELALQAFERMKHQESLEISGLSPAHTLGWRYLETRGPQPGQVFVDVDGDPFAPRRPGQAIAVRDMRSPFHVFTLLAAVARRERSSSGEALRRLDEHWGHRFFLFVPVMTGVMVATLFFRATQPGSALILGGSLLVYALMTAGYWRDLQRAEVRAWEDARRFALAEQLDLEAFERVRRVSLGLVSFPVVVGHRLWVMRQLLQQGGK